MHYRYCYLKKLLNHSLIAAFTLSIWVCNSMACPIGEGQANFVSVDTPKAFVQNGTTAHPFSLMEPTNTAISNDGTVYLLDSDAGQIKVINIEGKVLTIFSGQGHEDGQLMNPKGIALDQSGNLFVSDTGNNRIQRFSKDGKLLGTWGEFGYGKYQFIAPSGITTDAQFVYIADTGNNRIVVYRKNGQFVKTFGQYGFGAEDFNQPVGITTDGYGNLYIADSQNNRIKKYSRHGKHYGSWGIRGHLHGQLSVPFGLQLNAGLLYVAELGNHRIQVFKENGQRHSSFMLSNNIPTIENPADIRAHYPASFAISPSGEYSLACEPRIIRCQSYKKEKSVTSIIMEDSPRWENGPSAAHYASSITLQKGIMGILNPEAHRIELSMVAKQSWVNRALLGHDRVSMSDEQISLGSFGDQAGQFKSPAGIAMHAGNDMLAISDRHNHRIQLFTLKKDNEGQLISADFRFSIGKFGHDSGEFNEPTSLMFDSQGYLHVLDLNNQRIQIFNRRGHFQHEIALNLLSPAQHKFTANTHIIDFYLNPNHLGYAMVDDHNNLIHLVDMLGKPLRSIGLRTIKGRNREPQKDRFSSPYSVAINKNNHIFITDAAQQEIKRFNWSGELLNQWGEWGSSPKQFYKPKNLAIDSRDNTVYVVDYGNYRGQAFTQKGSFLNEFPIGFRHSLQELKKEGEDSAETVAMQ